MSRPKVFLDTSVLVAGLVDLAPSSADARAVLERAPSELERVTAWHCCLEFYSVVTRLPEEFRLEPADAFALLEASVLTSFTIVDLPAGQRRRLLQEAAADRVRGGRLYDWHIAQIARLCGSSTVVTDNVRDFAGLLRHGIPVMSCRDFIRKGARG